MKKAILLYPFFTIFYCVIFCSNSEAQERQFLLSDAEALFSKKQNEIFNDLANRNYSFVQRDGDIFEYRKTTPLGYFDISVLFTAHQRLKLILWQEHIVYANAIANEVQNGGYIKDGVDQQPGTDIVFNGVKNLRILISPHPETNTISLNMQIPPAASTQTMKPGGCRAKPKAVYHGK